MAVNAADRARSFAANEVDPETGEIRSLALPDRPDNLPENIPVNESGEVDYGDLEGLIPQLAIATSLKESEGERVTVVAVEWIPNPFYARQVEEGREGVSEVTAIFTWRNAEGRFCKALSANRRVIPQAEAFENLIRRGVTGIPAEVVAFETAIGTGYCFGSTKAAPEPKAKRR